jgi:transposase InsO family protein
MLWSKRFTLDRGSRIDGLVHHSDRGMQYVSIRYTERLAEAGIEPSVGSVGDSYDNALAESVIGLYKTEVIRRREPWRNLDGVEYATLEWVVWFNNWPLLAALPDSRSGAGSGSSTSPTNPCAPTSTASVKAP